MGKTTIKKEESKTEDIKSLPMQAYLDKTVMPLVLEGMAEVSKVKPENPITIFTTFININNQ